MVLSKDSQPFCDRVCTALWFYVVYNSVVMELILLIMECMIKDYNVGFPCYMRFQ